MSYADNVTGMVVKTGSSTSGPDVVPGDPSALPAGQWHSVSLPVADLGLDAQQMQAVIEPFVILPAWDDSQLGVTFRLRDVVLKMN